MTLYSSRPIWKVNAQNPLPIRIEESHIVVFFIFFLKANETDEKNLESTNIFEILL